MTSHSVSLQKDHNSLQKVQSFSAGKKWQHTNNKMLQSDAEACNKQKCGLSELMQDAVTFLEAWNENGM